MLDCGDPVTVDARVMKKPGWEVDYMDICFLEFPGNRTAFFEVAWQPLSKILLKRQRICIKSVPNFSRLEIVLKRKGKPDRVPFYELFSNIEEKVLGKPFSKKGVTDEEQWQYGIKRHIEHQVLMGYDYIICGANNFCFPKNEMATSETRRDLK